MNATVTGYLTLGEAAQRLGVPLWKLQAALDRGFYRPLPKVGSLRVVTEGQLPELREALARAGYLTGLTGQAGPSAIEAAAGG